MKQTAKSAHTLLIIIVLLALCARLAFVIALGSAVRWPDEQDYHAIAANIVEGRGYSLFRDYNASACGPTAYRSPLLPGLMAGLYLILGPGLLAVRVLQAILGACVVLLSYAIARELGYSARAGLLAAAGVACYPYYVFCAGAVYPVTVATVLVGGAVLALLRGRRRADIVPELGGGVMLGAAILAFGHVAASVPLVFIWVVRNKQNRGWLAAAAMTAAVVLTVTPWVVRNKIVMGKPVLSTAFAFNFCFGNHPSARWDNTAGVSDIKDPEIDKQTARLREAEAADLYMKIGIRQVRERPGRFVWMSLAKAANFWRFYPNPTSRPIGLGQMLVAVSTYGPALLLGLFWFVRDGSRRKLNWLMLLFPISWMALSAVTVSTDRYRMPADMFLIILAAAAVDSWLVSRSTKTPGLHCSRHSEQRTASATRLHWKGSYPRKEGLP